MPDFLSVTHLFFSQNVILNEIQSINFLVIQDYTCSSIYLRLKTINLIFTRQTGSLYQEIIRFWRKSCVKTKYPLFYTIDNGTCAKYSWNYANKIIGLKNLHLSIRKRLYFHYEFKLPAMSSVDTCTCIHLERITKWLSYISALVRFTRQLSQPTWESARKGCILITTKLIVYYMFEGVLTRNTSSLNLNLIGHNLNTLICARHNLHQADQLFDHLHPSLW